VVEFSKRKNYVISPFINLTDVNWRQINELVKQFTRFDQILSKIIIYDVLLLFIIWHVFFICLSQNGSMNIKYDEIIYIYYDRTNSLDSESLYLS